jgi:hypothetical protein
MARMVPFRWGFSIGRGAIMHPGLIIAWLTVAPSLLAQPPATLDAGGFT